MPEPLGYVLGLDLSLTRAAAVAVPVDFATLADFSRVLVAVAGHGLHNASSERERDARCVEVAETIEELAATVHVVGAFVEGYAFYGARAVGQPHALGELRAVVRRTLIARFGWAPTPVSPGAARSLFFGKVPKKPPGAKCDWLKSYILASVREVGAPFKHDDEADAFLVANYGLSEIGSAALSLAGVDSPTCSPSRSSKKRASSRSATT